MINHDFVNWRHHWSCLEINYLFLNKIKFKNKNFELCNRIKLLSSYQSEQSNTTRAKRSQSRKVMSHNSLWVGLA